MDILEPVSASRRSVGQPMDEKSLNLWRQIEDCRRREAMRPSISETSLSERELISKARRAVTPSEV
ncbi:MAG: hypothetical protein ACJ8FO_06070 [Sphingomicrobium sp.]